MNVPTADELIRKNVPPAREESPPLTADEAEALLGRVEGWALSHDGARIRREWTARNYQAAIDFFVRIAALAEQEGHHPDLHLEGYRHVVVELCTHAHRRPVRERFHPGGEDQRSASDLRSNAEDGRGPVLQDRKDFPSSSPLMPGSGLTRDRGRR